MQAFVVGGYVRDHYLRRPSTDIDVVVVGSGIALAEALARELKAKVSVFKTFGTAMVRARNVEVEFVGARRELYTRDSRKPEVEPGTLADDQRRRKDLRHMYDILCARYPEYRQDADTELD